MQSSRFRLARIRVGHTHHPGFEHAGIRRDHALDLDWMDVETGHRDHVLLAVRDCVVAGTDKTPVIDALMGPKEPVMPNGQRRPCSMGLSGEYPRVLDGLCKALSLDMRVCDPAWIGMKLRKLLNYGEPNGSFLARKAGLGQGTDPSVDDGPSRPVDDPPLRDAANTDR